MSIYIISIMGHVIDFPSLCPLCCLCRSQRPKRENWRTHVRTYVSEREVENWDEGPAVAQHGMDEDQQQQIFQGYQDYCSAGLYPISCFKHTTILLTLAIFILNQAMFNWRVIFCLYFLVTAGVDLDAYIGILDSLYHSVSFTPIYPPLSCTTAVSRLADWLPRKGINIVQGQILSFVLPLTCMKVQLKRCWWLCHLIDSTPACILSSYRLIGNVYRSIFSHYIGLRIPLYLRLRFFCGCQRAELDKVHRR